MAFREVSVVQIKEVLRRWLKGEGERPIAHGIGVDRKTARRYISAAVELGLDRSGGEDQLADELIGQMVERLRPHWSDGHGEAWRAACPGRPDDQVGGRWPHRRQDRGTASSPQGGVGHQNLDRCPELAVFATSDHDRPWHSPSVASACAGSSACSDPLRGPRRTRTSRSWCSATRC